MHNWHHEGSKSCLRYSWVSKTSLLMGKWQTNRRRDQVFGGQRRQGVDRTSSFVGCSREMERRWWDNSFPAMMDSRVDRRIREKRKYRERAKGTEPSSHHGSVRRLGRVSAHRRHHCSPKAIQGPHAKVVDRRVIHEVVAPPERRRCRYRMSRVHTAAEIYRRDAMRMGEKSGEK
jgi:hypothetical protein